MMMSVKSTAILLCNGAFTCMLLALFLQSYFSNRDGSSIKNLDIPSHGIPPFEQKSTRPELITPQGKIRGINLLTRNNRRVFGFLGIPYAQPPLGDLRFRAPLPAKPWEGTLDAGSDTEPCPQLTDRGEFCGVEDCLHLNVYTPQLPASHKSKLLPVMLYVIGGGYKAGNNSIGRFPPQFLLDKDVVLVFPNYRLGALGFLSTGDEVSPGNYGLKDIVQSLKWVQDNIQYFGGDPNQVTLYGGSSGAMGVHLLALSPLTDGLIHKYVTSSGTALSYLVNSPNKTAVNQANILGKNFGCPTKTSTLLVDCLRGLEVSQLVHSNSLFYEWKSMIPVNVWLPTVEPDLEGALLTDTPINLYAAGKIRDLPWMGTVTRDDGLLFSIPFSENPDLFEDFLDDIDFVLPRLVGYQEIVDDPAAYTTALKSYYLNDLTADRNLLLANLTQLTGDAQFIYPTYNALRQHLTLAKSPVYYCSLHFRGTFSLSYLFSGGSTHYTGVAHGDDLLYLFGHQGDRLGPPNWKYNEIDYVAVDRVVQLWTSFATNGIPSTIDSGAETIWEPYSSRNNYIRIGNGSDPTVEMDYDLYLERMQFWDELTNAKATSSKP